MNPFHPPSGPLDDSLSNDQPPNDQSLQDEHPDDDCPPEADPDRDFDEQNEDYLEYVIAKLQDSRDSTRRIKEDAAQVIAQAKQQEHSLWLSYESYLIEATRWHCQKSGQRELRKPSGSLSLEEEPGGIEISDEVRLVAWVQSHFTAVLALATALSAPPIPTARGPSLSPSRTQLEAVAAFYHATGLLPDGCQMKPPRTLLRLDERLPHQATD